MPSLDDLKKRIKSVKSTQKITKAMKMVAAAKLRKAQEKAENGRPYSEKMNDIILNLTSNLAEYNDGPALLTGNKKDNVYLMLIMTADRGLCGGFNSNITKLARKDIKKFEQEGKDIKIITVGSKGYDQLKLDFSKQIIKNISLKEKKEISFDDADSIGKEVINLFKEEKFDKCYIYYNKFKNVITQIPQSQQIIPTNNKSKKSETNLNYEFEPDETEILEELLPKNVSVQIFKGILENAASEQGSRMTAMDNATRNAGDLVEKLTIQYNRSRQASITKELIEIISGAESL